MANAARLNMSQRNLIWLLLIVAVAVIAWLLGGLVIGVIAGVVVLAVSEIVERTARSRRASTRDRVDA